MKNKPHNLNLESLPIYQKEWMSKVKKLILTQIDNPRLKVADLAFSLGVSERHFYRAFKQILGLTPNAYIRRIRMNKAIEYLDKGQFATISEVSFAVGYSRPDYFTKVFLQYHGLHPMSFNSKGKS